MCKGVTASLYVGHNKFILNVKAIALSLCRSYSWGTLKFTNHFTRWQFDNKLLPNDDLVRYILVVSILSCPIKSARSEEHTIYSKILLQIDGERNELHHFRRNVDNESPKLLADGWLPSVNLTFFYLQNKATVARAFNSQPESGLLNIIFQKNKFSWVSTLGIQIQ